MFLMGNQARGYNGALIAYTLDEKAGFLEVLQGLSLPTLPKNTMSTQMGSYSYIRGLEDQYLSTIF